ncbi:MAG TPA: hypothetical protein VK287_04385 [Gaiellaceae bacterium]|nr:hypothetical protein [Gaiellaceae bacterium]
MPRTLVLSYFEPRHLPRLLSAVRRSGLPAGIRVYLGSYGVGAEIGARIEEEGHRYAPMFQLRPDWYWERRRLPGDERKTLFARSSRSRKFGGQLPGLPQLLRLSSTARVNWGIELGARFRDELRAAARAGTKTAGWQLDEVLAETVGPQGRGHRELARGTLRGLVYGRSALGDKPQQGIVWWAHTAFVLAGRPITPELNAFWRILNRASLGLVGEEYPDFAGDPTVAAGNEAAGHRALQRGGPVRRALARKYVAGLTPGYRLAPGLGGNTRGLPRAGVNRWREHYISARAAAGLAGFGEFNFRHENSSAQVMQDVLRPLAEAFR